MIFLKKNMVYLVVAAIVFALLGGLLIGPYRKWRKGRQQQEVSNDVQHITDKGADHCVEDEIDRENLQEKDKEHVDTMDEETLDGIDTSEISDEILKKLEIGREDFANEISTFANENGISALGKIYSYDELYEEKGTVTVPLFFDDNYDDEKEPETDENADGRVNFDFVYQRRSKTYVCRMW